MKIKSLATAAIAISSAIILSTSPVSAEEATIENAFEQCGIGAAIFTTNKTAAVISNLLWDFGTTAVSSQTSSPSTCAGAQTTAAIFIDKTYPVLEEQFVKGSGSHVAALMDILECAESAQQGVISEIQSGLAASFSDSSFATQSQLDKAKQMGVLVDQAKMVELF